MTGYSKSQLTRLIGKKKKCGVIVANDPKKNKFPRKYTPVNIALLIKTAKAHDRLSGPATAEILRRECEVFGKNEYEQLSKISKSHIYNLREKRQYLSQTAFFTKTKPVQAAIGERRKPCPAGQPGFLRVDTVHQGDLDKEKGVYHLNIVDEVTQWEIVGCVEKISEYFLEPLLAELIKQFPFVIWKILKKTASTQSDNECAEAVQKAKVELFNQFQRQKLQLPTTYSYAILGS